MLRFPLHIPVMLITTGGKFIGRITHAGNDYIRAVDVVERILTINGDYLYTDNELSGIIHFSRDHIVGFKPLDNSEIYLEEQEYTNNIIESYDDMLIQQHRSKFKIIKSIKPNKNKKYMEK
ncbi:MAG: hypothetical protein ACOC33_01975 [bacterium]